MTTFRIGDRIRLVSTVAYYHDDEGHRKSLAWPREYGLTKDNTGVVVFPADKCGDIAVNMEGSEHKMWVAKECFELANEIPEDTHVAFPENYTVTYTRQSHKPGSIFTEMYRYEIKDHNGKVIATDLVGGSSRGDAMDRARQYAQERLNIYVRDLEFPDEITETITPS